MPNNEDEGSEGNEDIYTGEGRQDLLEDEDEITDIEEGFMQGYEGGEKLSVCNNCGKILEQEITEEEVEGELLHFCSPRCATLFEQRKKEK